MAKGFGVKLGSVFAISQLGFDNMATVFTAKRYVAEGLSGMDFSNKEYLLFVPSTIIIKNSVTAIFRIGDD